MSGRVAVSAPVGSEQHETTQAWWMPYVLQWGCGVLSLIIAALAHARWGDNPIALPWVAIGMFGIGGALTYGTFRITAVKKFLQIHATLSLGVGVLWLTAATISGPFTSPLIDLWLIGMPAMTASWTIRRLVGKGQKDREENGDSKLFNAVRLAKTKIKGEIEVGPNRATAQLQLPPGQLTADDVAKAKDRIASALSVGTTSVRVHPDPDHADLVTLDIIPQDMLKRFMPWPGPSAPGGSISEPLNIAIYEDGVHTYLWLPGDKETVRNATHLIVMGMNGSGKSHGAKLAWTEILTRRDVKLWLGDGAKGLQTVGAFAPYVDWLEPSAAGAQKMLSALPSVIEKRASWLGEKGLDQWVPGCGIPYLVVWIEEAAKVVREADEIADIVQTARSAGVTIVLSLQRPSYTQIPVDVRNQLGAVWCFGVKETADAAFALDDALLEAGADPAVWKNRKPGYSYLEAPGIDDDRMVSPLRTFSTTDAEMIDAIQENDPRGFDLDEVTAAAAGKAYRTRTRYTVDKHGQPVPLTDASSASTPANSENTTHNVSAAAADHESDEAMELLMQAATLIITSQFGSTSMLQRKLRVNHADATHLMRQLEHHGVVGPQPEDLDQARPVRIAPDELDSALAALQHDATSKDDDEDRPLQPARPGIHGRLTAADETDEAMALPENPDTALGDIDPDTELTPVEPGADFELPSSKPTTAEADAALTARLAEIRATGATTVGPKDIGKAFFDTVRTRPWVSARLAQLATTGALIESDREGTYLFPDHEAAQPVAHMAATHP